MKKLFTYLLVVSLIFSSAAVCLAKGGAKYEVYLADRYAKEFHVASCEACQNIAPENMVIFSSPEEAIKAGYKPCHICNPDGEGAREEE